MHSFTDMNYLTSSDARICFEQTKFLVAGNEDSVCVADVVEELLEKLSTIDGDHNDGECLLSEAAEFVKEACFTHSTVSTVLFDSFPSMKVAGPFLDVLPAVFSTIPSEQVEDFAAKLFELYKEDTIIVRVLSVLADVPLSARLADTIQRTIVDSLRIADSTDIPALLTVSLKISGTKHVPDIVSAWQDVLGSAPTANLPMVLEIIWSNLTAFERFALEWLEQISYASQCGRGFSVSAADLSIALISFSGSGGANLARKAKLVLQTLLRSLRCPHSLLISMPSLCSGSEVWDRMHAPLWQLCLWLMDPSSGLLLTCTENSPAAEGSPLDTAASSLQAHAECAPSGAVGGVLSLLAPLVGNLYRSAPTLREGITFSLITQCFPQVQGSITKTRTSSKAGKQTAILLPKLGQAHAALSQVEGPARARGRTFKEDRLYRRQLGRANATQRQFAYSRAIMAVNVLHSLCGSHVQVSEAVLQALLSRIYQQLADSDKVFPCPAIMHRLLECAAIGASNSSQLESTLLILIQKLLATASANDTSVVATLFSNRPLSLDALRESAFGHSSVSKQAQKRIPASLPLQAYSATTLGVMLAGNLLLRRVSPISAADHHALLNFITRSEPVLQSPSALYAADVLATCCYDAYLQVASSVAAPRVTLQVSGASSSSSSSAPTSAATAASTNAGGRGTDSLLHLVSNLQVVLDTLAKSVLSRTRANDNRNLDYCVIQLKDPVDVVADQRSVPVQGDPAKHWPLVQLCATTVGTTAPGMLARSVGPDHIAHALQETTFISSTLFHLVERLSFATTMLTCARNVLKNGTNGDAGSVLLPAVRISLLRDDTAVARRHTEMDADEVEDPVAGATPSTAFLTKWSGEAAEAFSGEFELKPELVSTTQALMLAWERGLIVATLVGHSQAVPARDQSNLLTLKLLCQLHACRLMLRAAHSKHMGYKQREITTPTRKRAVKTAKPSSSALKKRKSRSTYYEGAFVGSSYAEKKASSASKVSAGASKREAESAASAQIKNEFSEELQCSQRMSLQRSLTRSMQWVPVSRLLSCLDHILHLQGANTAAAAVPVGLLTDSGLALVSQLVHRLYIRNTSLVQRVNADDHFVSFFEAHGNHRSHDCAGSAVLVQEERLLDELLCRIPALLEEIKKARVNFVDIYGHHSSPSAVTPGSAKSKRSANEASTDRDTEDPVRGSEFLGQKLRSDGLKLMALTLFALLELRCPVLIQSQTSARSASLQLIASKYQEFVRLSTPKDSFLSVPTAPSSSASAGSASATASNACANALASIYNTLEAAILQQHDCAVVTAGLRALRALVPPSSAAALDRRFSSIGWYCFRAIFTESTSLAVHLLPVGNEVVPGMDESWPMLARAVAAQASLPAVVQEVERHVIKKTETVLSLFRPCFDTRPDFHSARMVTHQHDQLSVAAYRQFLQVWWASEMSANRVYGVALVIREIFSTMFAESAEVSSAAKKKLKSERRADSDDSDSEPEVNKITAAGASNKAGVKKSHRLAPEYLLTKHDSRDVKARGIFPFLVGSTVEFHLQVALPLLPVLFLLSSPCAEDARTHFDDASKQGASGYNASSAAGPYRNFAHVSMLFSWTTKRWLDILHDEHEHLWLLIKLAPHLVRICRATLAAVEAAVNRAVQWRSEQKQPQASDASVDVGALKYLQVMLSWALSVMRSIGTFAGTFKEMIIQTNQFDVPRMLVSSIPSLETYAERYIARLLLVAQAHSLNIVPKEGVDSAKVENKKYANFDTGVSVDVAQVGDKEMFNCMVQFLQRHHAAVLTPLASTAFAVEKSTITNAEGAHLSAHTNSGTAAQHTSGSYAYNGSYDDDSDAESEDFGFAALTSRHKRDTFGADGGEGWGLYSPSPSGGQSVASASSSMGDDTGDGSTEISEGGLWTDDAASASGVDALDDSMEFYSDEDGLSDN